MTAAALIYLLDSVPPTGGSSANLSLCTRHAPHVATNGTLAELVNHSSTCCACSYMWNGDALSYYQSWRIC